MQIDVANSRSTHSLQNKIMRVAWGMAWCILFRPTPKVCHAWRRFLLRSFGAKIGSRCHIYSSVKVWAPWNLTLGDHSTLSHHVDCYCVAPVTIGEHVTVSQYSYLCTASHDIDHANMPLITAPIQIGDGAWITACVFVGPGVEIGTGAVVGARSAVFKAVDAWTVVGGNPCRHIRNRGDHDTLDSMALTQQDST